MRAELPRSEAAAHPREPAGSSSARAAEFDYGGTQAVRALREEGYRLILLNSNPATIMTAPT